MGFVGPVVLQARLVYSEVCREKFSWDEPINGVYAKRWKSWVNGLKYLHEIKIPRCYKPKADSSIQHQLHFFSDALNAARGTVCLLFEIDFSNQNSKLRLYYGKIIYERS